MSSKVWCNYDYTEVCKPTSLPHYHKYHMKSPEIEPEAPGSEARAKPPELLKV